MLLDRFLRGTLAVAKWLVVPVVLLLFLQWPLRDLVKAGSREANDLGQILFAFYVALAVTAATRSGSHIAVDALARRYPPDRRRLLNRLCTVLVLVPWAGFVAWTAWPMVRTSVVQLERFQDTLNPGYFLIRVAVLVLAVVILLAAVIGPMPTYLVCSPRPRQSGRQGGQDQ